MNAHAQRVVRMAFLLGVFAWPVGLSAQQPSGWPEITQTARPWTRWWWHGSAVDEANLTRLLKEYRDGGLGGVEITCIYGVQGNEERNRDYLSDEWVDAVRLTLREADRLGLGVDLPAGSGWRMGGPSVTPADANTSVVLEKKTVEPGESVTLSFERSTPEVIVAYDENGDRLDLSDQFTGDGALSWRPPSGRWTVYALSHRWSGDRVKRPGPGGGGLNINPYSKRSVTNFLDHFGQTLDKLPGVRAQFHDSFEYEGDWQPEFLEEFAKRRGYRLEDHLPSLMGDGPREIVGRVKCDYRETLSDLVRDELIGTWVAWSHDHGQLARNQSHGSPANWLDLYAECDIPEIESFGRLQGGDADPLVMKFASSAANVFGKPLVSSETATWLDEHFHVTLDEIKQVVDRQILAGVNHVFYHGTAYSPTDAAWPGWLFYAATQLNPQNPIWRDLPALNIYVARCQSVLQESKPDNDVLLYWPLHDTWHDPRGLRMEIRVHNGRDWFYDKPLGDAAKQLSEAGFAFDFISDRGLAACEASGQRITAPGGEYQVVVVPKAERLALATLRKLLAMAEAGAAVVFWGGPPGSEPGMAGAEPSAEWRTARRRLEGFIDEGRVLAGDDLDAMLRARNVRSESPLESFGLSFLRKRWRGGALYFLHNNRDQALEEWIPLSEPMESATIMDPLTGDIGQASVRGAGRGVAVRVQLAPRQTLFVHTRDQLTDEPSWRYLQPAGDAVAIPGPWRVTFLNGGPALPEPFEAPTPKPWTEAPDKSAEAFAGTARYAATFDAPDPTASGWRLELGRVMSSARVRLNGEEVATLFAPPWVVELPRFKPAGNELEIDVTGVAANRIRDLDRRGVRWRVFEDINLVNINYRRFDASRWRLRPQGLQGPVTLTPLNTPAADAAE